MKRIHIEASHAYDILIGRGLLSCLGQKTAECVGVCTAAVIADDTVFSLYGERAEEALRSAGFRVVHFVFPHGEASKTLETYGRALNALCRERLTRSDVIVALGGGVVGDLAGFVAATYQRGIRFVQVPTTLLAMVDSSVGGKTAVDLDAGKNQAGCFHQPSLVLCDPELLATLPEEEYRCGCAEVIKYGVLGNAAFFEQLRQTPIREQYERVIEVCVTMKRDYVMADEFDFGRRRMLNLGHSVAHAIEACSDFGILHGQTVATGMAVIARAAAAKGICTEQTRDRLLEILKQYDLPGETKLPLDALYQAALSDKKLSGATMHLIVPEEIGRCRIESIPASEIRDWMYAGGIR